ncbi:MAG TPA: class I SAM-dependent methyltransferase [Candidatus Nanoarchaeia archaeon]|nr:class I SAM-dependent methyltransferase [Candidatus Nanoarchaeia archaeon]
MVYSKKLGKEFNKISKAYEKGRLDYPPKLINGILKNLKLGKGDKILDVGCGNGRSTLPFAKKGYNILGIDPGKDLISLARKKSKGFDNVKYQVSSFENFKSKPRIFNVILFGTSFHWVKEKGIYKKINLLLKDNGYLVIFYGFSNSDKSKLFSEIVKICKKHCPNHPNLKSSTRTKKILTNISKSHLFFKPKKLSFVKYNYFSKKEYINLLNSYSFVSSLDNNSKKALFDDLEKVFNKHRGRIKIPFDYIIILAKKKS